MWWVDSLTHWYTPPFSLWNGNEHPNCTLLYHHWFSNIQTFYYLDSTLPFVALPCLSHSFGPKFVGCALIFFDRYVMSLAFKAYCAVEYPLQSLISSISGVLFYSFCQVVIAVLINGICMCMLFNREDFFLVSQHVRQGTVSPTHYVTVADSSNLKIDHIQQITYRMTHMYYNWPGTVRVPAPCQVC